MQSLESWLNIKPKPVIKDEKGNEIKNKYFNDEFSYVNKFATVLNYLDNPTFIYSDKNAVIRLEDIKNDTTNTLSNLCSWLEISYNECLKTPSFEGHYYWGVSKTTPNIKGFSNKSIDRKIGLLFSKKRSGKIGSPFRVI